MIAQSAPRLSLFWARSHSPKVDSSAQRSMPKSCPSALSSLRRPASAREMPPLQKLKRIWATMASGEKPRALSLRGSMQPQARIFSRSPKSLASASTINWPPWAVAPRASWRTRSTLERFFWNEAAMREQHHSGAVKARRFHLFFISCSVGLMIGARLAAPGHSTDIDGEQRPLSLRIS